MSIFLNSLTCFVWFCFKVIVFEVVSILTKVNYSEDTLSIALFLHYVTANYILHVDRCLQSRTVDRMRTLHFWYKGIINYNVISQHRCTLMLITCHLISLTISDQISLCTHCRRSGPVNLWISSLEPVACQFCCCCHAKFNVDERQSEMKLGKHNYQAQNCFSGLSSCKVYQLSLCFHVKFQPGLSSHSANP